MRKSVEEKLKIVKSATSRKRIRKLADKHQVTKRTIRNWIKAKSEGKLIVVEKQKSQVKPFLMIKSKPLSELVLKISELHSVFKYRSIFRYLIKDKNYGFILCSYSSERSYIQLGTIILDLINKANESKIKISKIITDSTCIIDDLEALKCKNIIFEKKTHKQIKKYLNFALKKNSYLRNRTYYDNKSEFLNDSLKTVKKHNTALFRGFKMRKNKYINLIQNFNEMQHVNNINGRAENNSYGNCS
ncbi:MAG: helix-turn-helix domain containing protein [Candidatus Delongbacteria bacterium]|nr:helix-turn-helix domain containing protein [Candidatus Delongbacteria bacterium]